jgi:hypothetical protein
MSKKKPKTYKPGRYQYVVRSDGPVVPIKDLDPKDLPMLVKPRTYHSAGGLIKGKPKLTKKGWK